LRWVRLLDLFVRRRMVFDRSNSVAAAAGSGGSVVCQKLSKPVDESKL